MPGPGEARIRTASCAICATDLVMVAGWQRTRPPAIPGHEWSGVVDGIGPGVSPGLIGLGCVGENVLAGGGEVGFERPGGYAEYFITDAVNLRFLPAGYPWSAAALIEPLAVCVRAAGKLRRGSDRAALIIGDGPIGLVMLALLRVYGVGTVVLVGEHAVRLAAARELGAHVALDHRHVTRPEELASVLGFQEAFGMVVEASGSLTGLQMAWQAVGDGGELMVLGDYGEGRADFAWNDLLHREIEIRASNASAGAWDEAIALATTGQFPLGRLITHEIPAARFQEAWHIATREPGGAIKVVFVWTREGGGLPAN